MTPWAWIPVVALGMVPACSARVAVDPSGDGGGAEGGSTGGSGGAAVPAESACNQWCEANAADCGDIDSCLAHCLEQAAYFGSCAPAFEAVLACKIDSAPIFAPDCSPTEPATDCDTEDALFPCIYPAGPCTEGGCVVSGNQELDHAVKCDYVCGGATYTATCDHSAAGAYSFECVCHIDGTTVGTCQAVTTSGVGDFGCCSAYFADSQ